MCTRAFISGLLLTFMVITGRLADWVRTVCGLRRSLPYAAWLGPGLGTHVAIGGVSADQGASGGRHQDGYAMPGSRPVERPLRWLQSPHHGLTGDPT